MAGSPREHGREKGFWDGGTGSHGHDGDTAGRKSGFPGTRKPKRVGIRTDIEFPPDDPAKKHEPKI